MTVLALLGVWAVYVATLAPTVYVGDSGELTTAACLLGVPHPPGYPLFVWWGHLGTLMPLGNLAFRVNLATAVAGLGMVVLGAMMVKKLSAPQWIVGLAILLIGLNPLLWNQATAAEVYTVAGWALAFVGWMWMRCREPGQGWAGLAFTGGLAFVGHPVALLAGPVVAWGLWNATRGDWIKLPLAMLLIGLPFAAFLSLMIRALAHPSLAWGDTETIRGLVEHVLRQQYGGTGMSRSISNGYQQYMMLGGLLWHQWLMALALAAVGGWMVSREIRIYVVGVSLCVMAGLPVVLNFQFDPLSRDLVSMFLYPTIVPVGVAAAAGLLAVYRGNRWVGALTAASLSGFMLWQAGSGWAVMDRSRTMVGYVYSRDLLQGVEKGAVAFLEGDNVIFPLSYVRDVERWSVQGALYDETGNVLPPVYGLDFMRLPASDHEKKLQEVQAELMKSATAVHFNVGTHLANRHDFPVGSGGLLLKMGETPSTLRQAQGGLSLRAGGPDAFWKRSRVPAALPPPDGDYMARDLTGLAWYFFGEYWMPRDPERARASHEQVSRWAFDNETIHTLVGNAWLRHQRADEAEAWYRRAVSANPAAAMNYYNVGYALAEQGRVKDAESMYREALHVDPRYLTAWMGLGMMLSRQGAQEQERAVEAFRQAVNVDPTNPQAHYNLGALFGNQRRYAEAAREFEGTLRLDSSYARARQALNQIKQLQEVRGKR